jgi:hypothetical protein
LSEQGAVESVGCLSVPVLDLYAVITLSDHYRMLCRANIPGHRLVTV